MIQRQHDRRAEVYRANRDYARTGIWSTPAAVVPSDEDHLTGIHWMTHQDCGGTGRFPVPWNPAVEPWYRLSGKLVPSDFCVECKGTGLVPVMA